MKIWHYNINIHSFLLNRNEIRLSSPNITDSCGCLVAAGDPQIFLLPLKINYLNEVNNQMEMEKITDEKLTA